MQDAHSPRSDGTGTPARSILDDHSIAPGVGDPEPATAASGPAATPGFDEVSANRMWELVFAPGHCTEVRAILPDGGIVSGYFDDGAACMKAVRRLNGRAQVYATMNPVPRDFLARGQNLLRGDWRAAKRGLVDLEVKQVQTTGADDILEERILVVDIDPVRRPKDVASTDAELAAAADVARQVEAYYAGLGIPCVLGMSGNGHYVITRLYPQPMTAPTATDRARILKMLSARFSTAAAEVDVKIADPSRIMKFLGTKSIKGVDSPEIGRPHRVSRFLGSLPPECDLHGLLKAEVLPEEPKAAGSGTATNASGDTPRVNTADVMARARGYLAKLPPAISGQRGHDATYKAAMVLVEGFDLSADQARELMLEFNKRCEPPWTETEIEHKIRDAVANTAPAKRGEKLRQLQDQPGAAQLPDPSIEAVTLRARLFEISRRKLPANETGKAMAGAVVKALHERGRLFFHQEFSDHQTSMFFDGTAKVLLRLGCDRFQSWLATFCGVSRAEPAFSFILKAVEDEALHGETRGIVPAVYWSARDGAIYMSNGDGRMAKITATGVEIVDNGTDDVLFEAGDTLSQWVLTAPEDPFVTCSVFRDIALHSSCPYGRDLLRVYIVSLPTDPKCKPPITAVGPVGSGKTRVYVGVFELFGMPARIAKMLDNGEDGFWVAVDRGGLFVPDNVDTHIKWFADAVASASTGGVHCKRRLYSDKDEIILKAKSWVAITTTNASFAADSGLADRLLVIRMDRRLRGTAESALSREIAAHRNAGLSWICTMLSKALADRGPVPADLNKRHPDFAAFAVKLGRAMGREAEVIKALRSAEIDKSRFNLENDDVGAALLQLLTNGDFHGTASDLRSALTRIDVVFNTDHWSARKIGKRVAKLWPHLEALCRATQQRGHAGALIYDLKSSRGDYGEFPTAIPSFSRVENFQESLLETAPSHPPNPPLPSGSYHDLGSPAPLPAPHVADNGNSRPSRFRPGSDPESRRRAAVDAAKKAATSAEPEVQIQ